MSNQNALHGRKSLAQGILDRAVAQTKKEQTRRVSEEEARKVADPPQLGGATSRVQQILDAAAAQGAAKEAARLAQLNRFTDEELLDDLLEMIFADDFFSDDFGLNRTPRILDHLRDFIERPSATLKMRLVRSGVLYDRDTDSLTIIDDRTGRRVSMPNVSRRICSSTNQRK